MKFRITEGWRVGAVVIPAGTIISSDGTDHWSLKARGKDIPFNATPMDAQAWEEQLRLYADHRHLLGGGWQ